MQGADVDECDVPNFPENVAGDYQKARVDSPSNGGPILFGEVQLALRWRDVDLDARVITIRPSEDWTPKTEKARQVPIPDGLLPYLTGERKSPEWVFPCLSTGVRWAYWPNRKFDRARKAAGLEGGPHTLRHSYASHMVLQTRDFFLVARLLGHSTAWVTERYAHLLPEHLERARTAVSFGTLRMVRDA